MDPRRSPRQADANPRNTGTGRIPHHRPEEGLIPLFVAQHRHRPEDCPAARGKGPLLLSRVSAAAAARCGVTIQAEALLDGEHLLLLVVQAASQETVERFLAFLPGPADVQVLPALTAEEAVERGGCGPVRHRVATEDSR